MKNITIIIPTYNERENVKKLIPEIFKHAPRVSVIVVDDNSPDQTGEAVEELSNHFPKLSLFSRKSKEGLGRAYSDAFKKCVVDSSIEAVVMMDADFSHHPSYLPTLFKAGKEHDLVVASRYVKGGKTEGWELWRRLLSFWGNFYSRFVTGLPVKDTTGGFNFIKTSMLQKIDLNSFDNSGYAFQIELKHELVSKGAKVIEIPIVFKNRLEGESKISNHIIREGILAPWKILFKK
jgi:dolichol-phosphate mannosyltransferase